MPPPAVVLELPDAAAAPAVPRVSVGAAPAVLSAGAGVPRWVPQADVEVGRAAHRGVLAVGPATGMVDTEAGREGMVDMEVGTVGTAATGVGMVVSTSATPGGGD